MVRSTFAWWWLCVLGALSLSVGCKGTPAVQEPEFVGFELLDAGEEPREPLRYRIMEGTKTTSRVTWKAEIREDGPERQTVVGLESVEIGIEYGPSTLVDEGIRYPIEIVDAEVVAVKGKGKTTPKNIVELVEGLEGTGGRITFDNRGRILGGRYNEKSLNVPLRMLLILENTLSTIDFVILPDEDVGIGARWVSRATVVTYGVKMAQEAVYELVSRNGNDVVLDVTIRRAGDEQIIEPSLRESLEVISSRINGAGRIGLDLTALASNTTAEFDVRSELILVEDGEREVLNVDETIEVTVRSKTTKPSSSESP